MSFILHHWVSIVAWLLAVGIGITVVVAVAAVLEAYLDTRRSPKEEMYWCAKHGYFRKRHALPLFPELGGTAQNSFMCPICYKATVFDRPEVNL